MSVPMLPLFGAMMTMAARQYPVSIPVNTGSTRHPIQMPTHAKTTSRYHASCSGRNASCEADDMSHGKGAMKKNAVDFSRNLDPSPNETRSQSFIGQSG